MSEVDASTAGVHDAVVRRLQELRVAAGEPSYAEIARMVARLRVERGMSEHAALPARTTVYDAFRLGRRRLDRDLVEELTEVLVREAESLNRLAAPETDESAVPPAPVQDAESTAETSPETSPETAPEPAGTPAVAPAGPTARLRLWILLACVATNLVGLVFIDSLRFPLFLDMFGTAFAAIALGPWWGVGVGVTSSLLDGALTGTAGLWFTPVAAIGALVWGYGARSWGMARTAGRFLLLNTLVALSCSVLAVPITYFVFGGFTPHESGSVTRTLLAYVPIWLAVAISNVLASTVDKLVTGFVTLAVLDAWAARWPWLAHRLGSRARR